MKKVVFLALGVLSLTLFSFKSNQGGTVTITPGGMYVCEGTVFSPLDAQILASIEANHPNQDPNSAEFTTKCQTTGPNYFTKVETHGDGCNCLVNSADQVLSQQEIAMVSEVMSHYMDN